MTEQPFKVTIEGPGIAIERTVSEAVLPRLLAVLVTNVGINADLGESARSDQGITGATIGEFLSDLNITSNPERIAGIALFLRETLNRDRVKRDEIPEWFQRAGQPAPKNLFRDLKNAVAQRLIAEDHARVGEFLVTDTGVRTLRGKGTSTPVPPSPRKRTTRPRAQVQSGDSTKKRSAPNDGPTAKIQELIDEDWFKSPRIVAELITELAARGAHYKTGDLTDQMQRFVKNKKLRRKKEVPDGGKRGVWHYSNW